MDLFFVIISKSVLIIETFSIGKIAYGCLGQKYVWCDGDPSTEFNGYKSDFEINDVLKSLHRL